MGPLLVLAGAGSGKTRVITQRIAQLIERGVPAKAILALTFTNKAAGEMAERVLKITTAARGVTVSTFHAFGLSVLSSDREAIGGAFTIFDQGDTVALVKEVLGKLGSSKRFDALAVLSRISNAKNAFVAPEEFQAWRRTQVGAVGSEYDEIAELVYPRYQTALRNYRAFDFDDLVCEVVRLWKARPDLLARWRERFRFLLVDEYQDTNRAQFELLWQLCAEHRNICVVGDDDQAIYAWRGADVRNILEFENQFEGATIVKLEQNYRSTTPILSVANAVISKRTDAKHKKTLFTDRPGGEKVKLVAAATPDVEANYVGAEVRRWVKDKGKKPGEIAVLYRSNGQSTAIEQALREQGIGYRVVGGTQFFERKEVKDVLAYIKLSMFRSDEIALRRIINFPPRGIGDTSLERLATHALARGWSLWQAIERVDALDDIPSVAREGCKALERAIADLRKKLLVEQARASVAARELCETLGIRREIEATSPSPQAAARRWANVEALFQTFAKKENERGVLDQNGLAALLHALTLNFGEEEDTGANLVTLSTLHGSKGLEFDVVFLIGCEEGLLPHTRTLETRATDAEAQDIEEERRLFYVGVTRAREHLTMSRARARAMRGKAVARTPSRFLDDIPADLLETAEIEHAAAMSQFDMETSANQLLAALNALG